MAVKIRLQRHGKKGKPFYWVVAADARSKRDGKYLEKLGTYNPNTNPATIDLNLDNTVQWLHNGAQPTDTARAILSYKGALLKHHLDGGVRKGALTQDQADEKLAKWIEEKTGKVDAKKDTLSTSKADVKAIAIEAEKKVNADRIAAAKQAELDLIKANAPVATEVEEVAADVTEDTTTEAVADEAEPTVEAEATEEPTAQAVEIAETPAVEAVVAEAEVAAEEPTTTEDVVADTAEEAGTEEETDEAKA